MARLDKDGKPIPVPKPTSTKKKKRTTSQSTSTTPSSRTRKQVNARNRRAGKAAEKKVAELTGGSRTPMSGAIKNSNWNLTGDVQVKDKANRGLMKIEVKTTSTITPAGDKTFTLKKSVLDQAIREADDAKEIGAVFIHWMNGSYEQDDYVILSSEHFLRLLELAKIGSAVEAGREEGGD